MYLNYFPYWSKIRGNVYVMWIKLIQIINTLVITGSIIIFGVGCSLIPQTVTNNGDMYVGDAPSYNRDLQNAQINSYGFKLILISIGIFGGGMISCCCVCVRCKREELEIPVHVRKVRIAPLPSVIII
jgi:hypothetical protein